MYLTQVLHRAQQHSPHALATVCEGRRRRHAELVDRVKRLAGGLHSCGVAQGDRVGMLALNCDRYLEYYFATYWAGAVVNPINTRWSVAEIAYCLKDCDTRVLIVDDAHVRIAAELIAGGAPLRVIHAGNAGAPAEWVSYESLIETSAPVADALRCGDDIAGVFYTGGTTGFPKGVLLTHGNLYTNALSLLAENVLAGNGASGIHVAPMFHLASIGFMNALLMHSATQVFVPAFDPVAVLNTLAAENITDCFFVPTMIRSLVDHPQYESNKTSTVRRVFYGASPIDEPLLDRAMKAFVNAEFVQGYGMTELSPLATILPADCHVQEHHRRAGRLRSAGRPTVCTEVRVVDESDAPVPPRAIGEIVVRGPGTMLGYWNKPEETAAALRGGWMHTGDAGYLDEDGFLYVVDRLKDMIVTGGENVYSAEVENAILKHPSVAMCAVIGVPDAQWGERVHAVLVMRPESAPLDVETLRAHTRQSIAGYKCPRSLEVRDKLPLSATGKVSKQQLREAYRQGPGRQVS